jgi:hypothetical protein
MRTQAKGKCEDSMVDMKEYNPYKFVIKDRNQKPKKGILK